MTERRYDALVIGGGHNGLVHAAYLARAGLKVALLERREEVGGATLSQEAWPGFRFSVFSYLVSLLRPEIVHDLELVRHGLFLVPTECTLNPLPGGDYLLREGDPQRTYHNIARFTRRDAEALAEYRMTMRHRAHLMLRFQALAPPEVDRMGRLPASGEEWADLGRHLLGLDEDLFITFLQMLTMSSADFLGQWFEFDPLIAALSTSSIIGSFTSPRTHGSAYVLLHHYMGEIDGVYRAWGFQKGGTGELAQVLLRAAVAHGVEVRTGAPVAQLFVKGNAVRGVVLENGDVVESTVVSSSAAPQVSLLRLPPTGTLPRVLLQEVARWDSFGISGKVNLALDGLPAFAGLPATGPHLSGGAAYAPSVDFLERGYDQARDGLFSSQPFIDLVIPSVLDPDMAPPGQHVLSCFVQYAPYRLAAGEWDDSARAEFGDAVVSVLEEFLPGVGERILHRQVLVPPDIERIAGIPGGNIFHGELRLSQLFLARPAPGLASYRTPIGGYYLCGSSTHPGGGISGAPGRLAAQRVLADFRAGQIRGTELQGWEER